MAMTGSRLELAGNVLGNQAVWLCAVAGAGRGLAWPGVASALVYCTWQLRGPDSRGMDLKLIVAALLMGSAIDGAMAASGWLAYAAPWPSAGFAPAWILALWAAFAMLPMHALAWLRHRPLLAFALGAVGGPLAYLAAARGFGAVALAGPPLATVSALSVAWGVALVVLMQLAVRARGRARPAPAMKGTGA
ncbi:DUF2878 domain-containing protein [Lysobacter sp. A3-1-A15]|uniref:DUF2878 domain-containing protein n=1 Tax=Novilysobacter viscosus TaxID=3098602 RepID=UPI002ED91B98